MFKTPLLNSGLTLLMTLFATVQVIAQQGITPEDYYKTVFVSQTEISPSGTYIAFTKTTIDVGENARHSEVWMQKLSDGEPDGEPFRSTDPTVQSSNPRWSPDVITHTLDLTRFDGRVITSMRYKSDGTSAWLPHPPIQQKRQLHIISADGGEPEKITDLPFHVWGIEWSADGTEIHGEEDWRTPMTDAEQLYIALMIFINLT